MFFKLKPPRKRERLAHNKRHYTFNSPSLSSRYCQTGDVSVANVSNFFESKVTREIQQQWCRKKQGLSQKVNDDDDDDGKEITR